MSISVIETIIFAFEIANLNELRPESEAFGKDIRARCRPKK